MVMLIVNITVSPCNNFVFHIVYNVFCADVVVAGAAAETKFDFRLTFRHKIA